MLHETIAMQGREKGKQPTAKHVQLVTFRRSLNSERVKGQKRDYPKTRGCSMSWKLMKVAAAPQ